jgi:hypothetical protein
MDVVFKGFDILVVRLIKGGAFSCDMVTLEDLIDGPTSFSSLKQLEGAFDEGNYEPLTEYRRFNDKAREYSSTSKRAAYSYLVAGHLAVRLESHANGQTKKTKWAKRALEALHQFGGYAEAHPRCVDADLSQYAQAKKQELESQYQLQVNDLGKAKVVVEVRLQPQRRAGKRRSYQAGR